MIKNYINIFYSGFRSPSPLYYAAGNSNTHKAQFLKVYEQQRVADELGLTPMDLVIYNMCSVSSGQHIIFEQSPLYTIDACYGDTPNEIYKNLLEDKEHYQYLIDYYNVLTFEDTKKDIEEKLQRLQTVFEEYRKLLSGELE